MANVLITGGVGFIGCNLAARYLKKENHITILDDFSRKGSKFNAEWLKNNFNNIKIIKGDIRNKEDISKALVDNIDLVFHLAGQVAVTTSIINPIEDFEINAFGTVNLLEAVRNSKSELLELLSGLSWYDPAESPDMPSGVSGEQLDAFIRHCGRLGKGDEA